MDNGLVNDIAAINREIDSIANNSELFVACNFCERADAIDHLEFWITGRVDGMLAQHGKYHDLLLLQTKNEQIKASLELVDKCLFQQLKAELINGLYRGEDFKNLVGQYIDLTKGEPDGRYDNLDLFVNRLLPASDWPAQSIDLEPEMVYYQKTPARVVFEMAQQCGLITTDVFFDIGCGLGQVAILISLLTGAQVKGIEIDPAFCAYSVACAGQLNLNNIEFLTTDARDADYTQGTCFFMYSPFTGVMLDSVLERIRRQTADRQIRVITYGPCTAQVARQSWLTMVSGNVENNYRLALFSS
ncbi:class I SAM-dependent methyltransferase [Mucilaginibacter sp.]|uniref:class I SAM-dependent methyltransferase n=1 Tax=Mucilaginibacter sp. TaxID=1882438 RepID=UPI0035BC35BD